MSADERNLRAADAWGLFSLVPFAGRFLLNYFRKLRKRNTGVPILATVAPLLVSE